MEKFSKLNKRGGRGWNMIPKINKRASPFIRKLRVMTFVGHYSCSVEPLGVLNAIFSLYQEILGVL